MESDMEDVEQVLSPRDPLAQLRTLLLLISDTDYEIFTLLSTFSQKSILSLAADLAQSVSPDNAQRISTHS